MRVQFWEEQALFKRRELGDIIAGWKRIIITKCIRRHTLYDMQNRPEHTINMIITDFS